MTNQPNQPSPTLKQGLDVVVAEALTQRVTTGTGALTILSNVSLRIRRGEAVAIVGASGSGKSTLLGLLAGLDSATEGNVQLAGQVLGPLDEDARARIRAEKVSFIFQSFQLLSSLTALENVMLPLEMRGDSDAAAVARKWLDKVGLVERMTHLPKQLSGGEQQRVAIARAFAMNPEILFADEPTGNLDTATGTRIIDLLFELNKAQQTTLILVTHDADLAARCDRCLTLVAGVLQHDRTLLDNIA